MKAPRFCLFVFPLAISAAAIAQEASVEWTTDPTGELNFILGSGCLQGETCLVLLKGTRFGDAKLGSNTISVQTIEDRNPGIRQRFVDPEGLLTKTVLADF